MEDDENQLTPCITDDGYTFLYVKHNNLFRQTYRQDFSHGVRVCLSAHSLSRCLLSCLLQ